MNQNVYAFTSRYTDLDNLMFQKYVLSRYALKHILVPLAERLVILSLSVLLQMFFKFNTK